MELFKNIPKELKELKQWVCWKKVPKDNNKVNKIPINPYTGLGAKVNDNKTWSTFDEAIDGMNKYQLAGIGFIFDNGYFGVDLDDCTDELKTEFINTLQSYTEISQSGNGIHIICKGKLPEGRRRHNNVEMYDDKRFFVMTGNAIGNYTIKNCEQEILFLYEKYLGIETPENTQNFTAETRYELSDDEVINKASKAKQGLKFNDLYKGDYENYFNSQSEADLAFCNMLAFWTGKDATQMDRIFRNSGLYREKWDEVHGATTYGNMTINKAIATCQNVFGTLYRNEDTGEIIDTEKAKNYDLNDTGNAHRLYDTYGENIKYNVENKCFMLWNGKYWEEDSKMQVKQLIEKMANTMKQEAYMIADGLVDEDEKENYLKPVLKNINRLLNSSGKEACLKEVQHLGTIPATNNDFDRLQNYLNVKNGVINLRTGELLPHERNLMMTKCIDIEMQEGKPKRWNQFLSEVFVTKGGKPDKELIEFIKKVVGYSLTGSTKEQCLFMLIGNGSNGKSVFLDIISSLMGSYSMNLKIDSLLANKYQANTGANSDIARLKGARLVTTSEPNDNSKFNEGLVKEITGGDRITARFLYGKEFEYKPEFKIWIASNPKIIIRGTDDGIWRRIVSIPFNAKFTEETKDKNLTTKLQAELPKILSWAVQGCIDWFEEGWELPKAVKEFNQEYKEEMDVINAFIEDKIKEVDGERTKASLVFEAYSRWTKLNNEFAMSSTKFGREFSKRYEKKKYKDGIYYEGVSLNTPGGYVYES